MVREVGLLVYKIMLHTFAAFGFMVFVLVALNSITKAAPEQHNKTPTTKDLNVGLEDSPIMCGDPKDMEKVIDEGGGGTGVERGIASLRADKSVHIDLNVWYNPHTNLLTIEVVQYKDGKAIKSCAPYQGVLNPNYLKSIMPEWRGLQVPKGANPGEKF